MEINSELYQPVRFYNSTNSQFFERNPYLNDCEIPLVIANKARLFPFLLTRNDISDFISGVYLKNRQGVAQKISYGGAYNENIVSLFTFIYIATQPAETDYIRYFANTNLSTNLPLGIFYLELTDGTNTWYSDYFKIGHYTETIELEYYNTHDFAGFLYNNSYKNRVKLSVFIQDMGDYESYKEVIEDFNKNKTTTYHREQKIYQLTILVNSQLYDAMRIMAMHDTIQLTNRLSESSYIEIDELIPTPIEGTSYMKLIIKFRITDDYFEYTELLEDTNYSVVQKILSEESGKLIATEDGDVFKVRF